MEVWLHTFLTTALDGVTHLPLLPPDGEISGSKNSNLLQRGALFWVNRNDRCPRYVNAIFDSKPISTYATVYFSKNIKFLLLNVQLQLYYFLVYTFLKREACWWLSGAAKSRSSLGHYRRFGTNLSVPPSLQNNPEERCSHLLRGGNLKSRKELSRLLQWTVVYRLLYCYLLCSGSDAPDFSRDDSPKRREKLNHRNSGTSWNTWLPSSTAARTPNPSTQHSGTHPIESFKRRHRG